MNRLPVFALWFLALCLPGPIRAQTDAEYLSSINFRFSNPGARARGMGGNLVAFADDDAAAVFVNPAGVAFTESKQVTLEFVSEEDEFLSPRVETGVILNGGGNFAPKGPARRRSVRNDADSVSFASYMNPLSGGWGVSLYYANLFDAGTGAGDVFIDGAFFPDIDPDTAFRPISSTASARNKVLGASVGYRIGEDLAVGISAGISQLDFSGSASRGRVLDPGDIVNSQRSSVDGGEDLFLTIGGLWKISEKFSLGGSWQKQTGFKMANRFEVEGASELDRAFESEFTIPTRYALGLAFRHRRWTIGLEIDHIQYSDLFNETRGQTFFGEFSDDSTYGYEIRNVTEYHLGFEKIISYSNKNSWSLQAGVWRDESHLPFYTGQDPLNRAWAPEEKEEIIHWTVGVGFESKGYALGVAADFSSDAGTDVLASVNFVWG